MHAKTNKRGLGTLRGATECVCLLDEETGRRTDSQSSAGDTGYISHDALAALRAHLTALKVFSG